MSIDELAAKLEAAVGRLETAVKHQPIVSIAYERIIFGVLKNEGIVQGDYDEKNNQLFIKLDLKPKITQQLGLEFINGIKLDYMGETGMDYSSGTSSACRDVTAYNALEKSAIKAAKDYFGVRTDIPLAEVKEFFVSQVRAALEKLSEIRVNDVADALIYVCVQEQQGLNVRDEPRVQGRYSIDDLNAAWNQAFNS